MLLIPCASNAVEHKRSNSLRFGITLSQSFGDTHYELQAKAENPAGGDELVDIRSRLEFPLDVTLLGIFVEWTPGRSPSRRWTVNARFDFNLDDPSDKMTDEDWINSKQLSYSESPSELDMLIAAAEVVYHLRPGARTAADLLFHFDYQRIEQHMVGYEGWQGTIFSDKQFPVSGTAPVLDYTVDYFSPQLGAARYDISGWRHKRLPGWSMRRTPTTIFFAGGFPMAADGALGRVRGSRPSSNPAFCRCDG